MLPGRPFLGKAHNLTLGGDEPGTSVLGGQRPGSCENLENNEGIDWTEHHTTAFRFPNTQVDPFGLLSISFASIRN